MNNDFEQQFMQGVKVTQPAQTSKTPKQINSSHRGASSTPFIIAIAALGVALLLESIVLIFFAVDHFGVMAANDDPSLDEREGADEGKYVYNSDFDITALNLTCIAEDGARYNFNSERKYQFSDTSAGTSDSGTYSVLRDSVVTLTSPTNGQKVVYFDGDFIADGTKMYDCGV